MMTPNLKEANLSRVRGSDFLEMSCLFTLISIPVLTVNLGERSKTETAEEKRERKKAVKEQKKVLLPVSLFIF